MSTIHLTDVDGQDTGEPPLVMIFLRETAGSFHGSQSGGGLARSEATGCIQPWKNLFQYSWNLEDEPGPPESWEAPLQFEAVLDGRRRTIRIGPQTYPLTDARTFIVQFGTNLEATVTQTDAEMRDVPLSAKERALIEEMQNRRSILFQRRPGRSP